jgi:hypothetical protein
MTDHFYHAFVKLKGAESFRVLGLDLSSDDLRKKICNPYRSGKDIYISSTVTSVSDIQQLSVVRSAQAAEDELKRISDEHDALIKRRNEESGLVIIGSSRGTSPLELMESCDDVTDSFIADAPGSGTFATKAYAFFHNQWVTGIGLLIIGILIGKYFGAGA